MVKNRIKRGSFTIEAALVMPLVLMAVMGLLYLSLFVHNRTWLTAAAYEAALSGSMEGLKKDGKVSETARMKSEELGGYGFFGAENLEARTEGKKEVKVTYELDTTAGFGMQWHLQAKGSAKVINPVKWVRKLKAAADAAEGFGDSG